MCVACWNSTLDLLGGQNSVVLRALNFVTQCSRISRRCQLASAAIGACASHAAAMALGGSVYGVSGEHIHVHAQTAMRFVRKHYLACPTVIAACTVPKVQKQGATPVDVSGLCLRHTVRDLARVLVVHQQVRVRLLLKQAAYNLINI